MPSRYIILGAGAAGIAAATTLRDLHPHAEIVVVSDDPHGYYSRPGLAYFLTGELPERHLFPFSPRELRERNIAMRRACAIQLDTAGHRLQLSDGEPLFYDRLLLATGSLAATVDVPGGELAGVVKLDNLEDARQIVSLGRKARAAVVVGGGITALEIVEGLRHHCRRVHYFLRGDRYWSNVLDPTESGIVESRLAAEGVQLHYRTELAAIEGRNGRVAAVLTKAGERISCELLAFAVGVRPRVELAREAGLRLDRGVLVDEHLRTSAEDVYAAGDVAQVYDPLTGAAVLDTLWNVALAQGRVAAKNMAGSDVPYLKSPSFNVTRLTGLTTTIIGAVGRGSDADLATIARGDSETWRGLFEVIVAEERAEVNRVRVLVAERTLAGALVMGDQGLSRPLQDLVGRQVDILPVRERLLDPRERIEPVLTEFWQAWRQRHAQPGD